MKKTGLFIIALISLALLSSCEKNDPFEMMNPNREYKAAKIIKTPLTDMAEWPLTGCSIQSFDLIAGKSIFAGTVEARLSEDILYVKYDAADGCEITEAHLFVGGLELEIPSAKKGNPKIGHFPYFWDGQGAEDIVIFDIALADLGLAEGDCIKIAAHAVVNCPDGEETAWARDYGAGVFAVKSQMTCSIMGPFKSYVMTGIPGVWDPPQCDNFTYFSIADALADGYVNLVYYVDGETIYGKVTVEEADGILTFTITSNTPDGLVYASYLYTGTVEGFFAATPECDSYQQWEPRLITDNGETEHVFNVPYSGEGTAVPFEGNRWGWSVSYCPVCD